MYAKVIRDRETFDRILSRGESLLVDVRSPVEFRNGNVDGSVNLPLRNFINKITSLDRKTKLVMYGSTLEDGDLTSGVNYAAQLGFDKIFISDYSTIRER
jgi:rhodanese-related sulfurtransferase